MNTFIKNFNKIYILLVDIGDGDRDGDGMGVSAKCDGCMKCFCLEIGAFRLLLLLSIP